MTNSDLTKWWQEPKKAPWWETDNYTDASAFSILSNYSGPEGLACVSVYDEGRTQKGWGLVGKNGEPGFMENYMGRKFAYDRAKLLFEKRDAPFAFVMRSMKVICIDIDGKNDGLEHVSKLGALPPTLAETSKSGNGYHLFYEVDDKWDFKEGFNAFSDRLGIVQGVDVRYVGCVYHYPTQRWNEREMAPLPRHLIAMFKQDAARKTLQKERIEVAVQNGDPMELALLHSEILDELAKPVAQGKRNITMYAIGHKMAAAQIEDWDQVLQDRCHEIGLDADEAYTLVCNIRSYAPAPE